MSEERHKGIVVFFNDTGRYGFIESDAVQEDVFFHMEDIDGPNLTEGTQVTFELEQAPKGPRAVAVERDSDLNGDTHVFDDESQSSSQTAVYANSTTKSNEPTPKFCPYCGEDLSMYPEGSFCSSCGKKL